MTDKPEIELSVSQFVGLLNQTLEYAYPSITIVGELANFKVWQDRLVFFDLKENEAIVNCWAYVTQLPGPLENGMMLKVRGQPRYHPNRGFRFNSQYIKPAGEGSIKRAADLLRAKLKAEGLFDQSRKRLLPYPPQRIGLIASKQSAAYADFVKIINQRWRGLVIEHLDVQVQGEAAPPQLVAALEQFNVEAEPPDVLVLIRGGGSAEDLAAFSSESVVRAVAASRVPTLVAIGHEVDLSLAELTADKMASTPSNAAEILVPDRQHVLGSLQKTAHHLNQSVQQRLQQAKKDRQMNVAELDRQIERLLNHKKRRLGHSSQLLTALSPAAILRRGYAVVRYGKQPLKSVKPLSLASVVSVQLASGSFSASVQQIKKGKA